VFTYLLTYNYKRQFETLNLTFYFHNLTGCKVHFLNEEKRYHAVVHQLLLKSNDLCSHCSKLTTRRVLIRHNLSHNKQLIQPLASIRPKHCGGSKSNPSNTFSLSSFLLPLPEWWGAGVVICLERGADLHMAQLMSLPHTVSCFSKIQIGFTFLVLAHLGSPGKRAVKRVSVLPPSSLPSPSP